jgi:hypothetical protein
MVGFSFGVEIVYRARTGRVIRMRKRPLVLAKLPSDGVTRGACGTAGRAAHGALHVHRSVRAAGGLDQAERELERSVDGCDLTGLEAADLVVQRRLWDRGDGIESGDAGFGQAFARAQGDFGGNSANPRRHRGDGH